MSVTLSINSSELNVDDVHELTLDLSRTLERESDISAELAEGPTEAGSKGEPITVGLLILTFLTSGAAVSMFGVLKSYFERDSSLEMNLEREDGRKLAIRAENMSPDQINRTIEAAREFFEG